MMYKIDTHVHTKFGSPCAHTTAQRTVELYAEAGYDALVITNHYHPIIMEQIWTGRSYQERAGKFLYGYHAAAECAKKFNMTIILGMEINFPGYPNDYLLYGFDEEFVYSHPDMYRLGIQRFKEEIVDKDSRLLLVHAHPFRASTVPTDASLLHGVEVFNGNVRHENHNDKALSLAKENGLFMLSGSDFHEEEDAGLGGIKTKVLPKDSFAFANLIRSGNYELITK